MATCKDCVHFGVCYLIEHYGADPTEDGMEHECQDFKDRNEYKEVVRCKDCVYWAGGENTIEAYGKTWSGCKYTEKWRAEDDYCSCGERRCDNEVD